METREKIILKVLDKILKLHKRFYLSNRPQWNISREELLNYPMGSLGNELGLFLLKSNFHSIPMIERHDVFHLLFGFETHVKDEIAMLFFQVGNGKVTPFTTVSAFGAALFYPECFFYFIRHFNRGRNAISVSNWNFRPFLNENFTELQDTIFLNNSPAPSLFQKIKVELTKTKYHGNYQAN